MSVWASLLPVAMVGTERQSPAVPILSGAIGELLDTIGAGSDNPAKSVLQMAAVLAACSQAGARGAPWPEPVPAASPPEALPTIDDTSTIALFTWALRDGPSRLQHLALQWLAAKGCRLPIELLPLALEMGRRSTALRTPLLPVLGERGVWLAGLNTVWNYAVGVATQADEVTRWAEGNLAQRRTLLREQRRREPSAARERLSSALGELPGRERVELLAELVVGLSMEDESLLDGLRLDRSREVRQVVLGLLLRLPDCAHVQRAQQRLQQLLRQERVLLRKRWLLDAPSAVGDDWKADNIEAIRPPHEKMGERAWWLYQLARQVPLAWWCRQMSLNPSELIDWAADSDWADSLLRAWCDLLCVEPDVDWCEAMLDNWPKKHPRDSYLTILALLPLARRERYWDKHLRSGGRTATSLQALVPQILQACPPGELLSVDLSLAIADAVADAASGNAFINDYALRGALPELCCVLQTAALKRLTQIPRHADETPSLAELWHTVELAIATRQILNY